MNSKQRFISGIGGGLILNACLCTPVLAQHTVTYSPEQWPKRWSSAIRQQQSGRYPERNEEQMLNDNEGETFSDEDLFLNSPEDRRYEPRRKRHRAWNRRSRDAGFQSRYRERRYADDVRGYPARQSPYPAYPYAYGSPGYMSYPAYGLPYSGYGLYGVDPLLTYPGMGWGYPSLLGPSLGYPYPGGPGFGLLGAPPLW
ncbi:MAG: hypothetical protein GC149_14645 [Gammaproteobacteria bacterium]|nr:hypothetical protein [Gammaproteobacteria bacterium]